VKKTILLLVALVIIAVIGIGIFNHLATDDLDLSGVKVAVLLDDEYNEKEASSTINYLEKRNAEVAIVGIKSGSVSPYDKVRVSRDIDVLIKDICIDDYDALVVPGGYSATNLSENDEVLTFVRDFYNTNKPCAAICLGPVVFVNADIVNNKSITSYAGLQNASSRAGANWENTNVVVDSNIITSRRPQDLRRFNAEIGLMIYNNSKSDSN